MVSSGIRQVCEGKIAWYKKEIQIVVRFNGLITCKLEMDSFFFFHNSEISAVRHVYVTQLSLKRAIHVTRDMAVAQEVSLPK